MVQIDCAQCLIRFFPSGSEGPAWPLPHPQPADPATELHTRIGPAGSGPKPLSSCAPSRHQFTCAETPWRDWCPHCLRIPSAQTNQTPETQNATSLQSKILICDDYLYCVLGCEPDGVGNLQQNILGVASWYSGAWRFVNPWFCTFLNK